MDGVFEDSPWLPIIRFIDDADRVLHSNPNLLASLGFVSVYYAFMGSWLDLLLNACFLGWRYRSLVASLTFQLWQKLYTTLLPTVVAFGATFLMLSALNRKVSGWTGSGRPYLVPCKTTHTRMFPQKHSFSYSYLVVGIPVGISGNFNGMLSVRNKQSQGLSGFLSQLFRSGWYNVNASDYLQRGLNDTGLRGKLDTYLCSQVCFEFGFRTLPRRAPCIY